MSALDQNGLSVRLRLVQAARPSCGAFLVKQIDDGAFLHETPVLRD
jgi:hypothetical protein